MRSSSRDVWTLAFWLRFAVVMPASTTRAPPRTQKSATSTQKSLTTWVKAGLTS